MEKKVKWAARPGGQTGLLARAVRPPMEGWKTPWAVWLENQACDIGPLKGL